MSGEDEADEADFCFSDSTDLKWGVVEDRFQGTLWFEYAVGDRQVTVGSLDWHAGFPSRELGLVGEWFYEQVDLSEYRAGCECPDCGGELLNLPMHSVCESIGCEFFFEGNIGRNTQETHSLGEWESGPGGDQA